MLYVGKAQEGFDDEGFPDPYSDGMSDPYSDHADPYGDESTGGPSPPRQLTSVEEIDNFIKVARHEDALYSI
ncbi:hypothetical protein EON65_44480 [archaeon]|nr:MAG: hypothetical protein EON65_44480 [archaeon]